MSIVENCFLANCNNCIRATTFPPILYGNKKYVCAPHPKKHGLITARTCKHFRCVHSSLKLNCATCTATYKYSQ